MGGRAGAASWWRVVMLGNGVVGGPGGDLLSHVLGRSTMGASGFHGRVRNGVGWGTRAIGHQVEQPPRHPACGGRRGGWSRQVGMGWMRLSLMGVEVDRAIR